MDGVCMKKAQSLTNVLDMCFLGVEDVFSVNAQNVKMRLADLL